MAARWQVGGYWLMVLGLVACGSAAPAPVHTRAVVIASTSELDRTCEQRCAAVKRSDERVVDCLNVGLPQEDAHRFRDHGALACMLEKGKR